MSMDASVSNELTIRRDAPPTRRTQLPWKDDVERFVCHEDHNKMTILSLQVKEITDALARGSLKSPMDFVESYDHFEAQVILQEFREAQMVPLDLPTLHRGVFPSIDHIINEHMKKLKDQFQFLVGYHTRVLNIQRRKPCQDAREPQPKNGSIAVKHEMVVTNYLIDWMVDHAGTPFPTKKEIEQLSDGCALSFSQVNCWATNVRKRNNKGSTKENKKLNSFLDFLFMAHHREATAKVPVKKKGRPAKFSFKNRTVSTSVRNLMPTVPISQANPPSSSASDCHPGDLYVARRPRTRILDLSKIPPPPFGMPKTDPFEITPPTGVKPTLETKSSTCFDWSNAFMVTPVETAAGANSKTDLSSLLQLDKFDKFDSKIDSIFRPVTDTSRRDVRDVCATEDPFAALAIPNLTSFDELIALDPQLTEDLSFDFSMSNYL